MGDKNIKEYLESLIQDYTDNINLYGEILVPNNSEAGKVTTYGIEALFAYSKLLANADILLKVYNENYFNEEFNELHEEIKSELTSVNTVLESWKEILKLILPKYNQHQ